MSQRISIIKPGAVRRGDTAAMLAGTEQAGLKMVSTSMTLSARQLMISCAAMYLMLVAALLVGIRHSTGGHFAYALDDPYIHLALAENLAHGHYGINAGEAASPSSSLLWPFLLVPFAGTAIHTYLPLFWCVIAGVAASALFGWIIDRWQSDSDGRLRLVWYQQLLLGLLLILVANLASLTIVGMEHVSQVLLAICCAFAVMEALAERPVSWWCVVAAVVAPSVRYEDVSLTLVVCVALAAQRRWAASLGTMGLGLAPLAAFSWFLKSDGLPALPLSVLLKADAYVKAGPIAHGLELVRHGLTRSLDMERLPTTMLCLAVIWLTLRARTRQSVTVLAGAAALAILQVLIGRFNWFHRYEVYALVFLVLVVVERLIRTTKLGYWWYAAGLACFSLTYIYATLVTVTASTKIYRQQYQMHRFITEYYSGNYAVNDLGLASFRRRPGMYVLDLVGLGSLEAARQEDKSSAWLKAIAEEHRVDLAMIYPTWFDKLPDKWTPLATMCEEPTGGIAGHLSRARPCMVYYSTTAARNGEIRGELRAFAVTLPAKLTMKI